MSTCPDRYEAKLIALGSSWYLAGSIILTEASEGLVIATISADFFQKLYAGVDVGPKGLIALTSNDGTVIVRKPFVAANIGRHITIPSSTFEHPWSMENSSFDIVSPVDGERRLGSFYPLEEYPLFVMVAEEKARAFADWRQDAITNLAGIVLLVGFHCRAR